MSAETAAELRARILELVGEYHAAAFPDGRLPPRRDDRCPVSGKVFDADEMRHLVEASLDFWLTTGRFAAQFEREFARWIGVRHAILVNSGLERQPARAGDAHRRRARRSRASSRATR